SNTRRTGSRFGRMTPRTSACAAGRPAESLPPALRLSLCASVVIFLRDLRALRVFVINCRAVKSGRHFLQIPGPTNVPDRVLRAMAQPTIDHRGPTFAALAREVLEGLQQIFQTKHPVVIYPSSGTGAWEAALVN